MPQVSFRVTMGTKRYLGPMDGLDRKLILFFLHPPYHNFKKAGPNEHAFRKQHDRALHNYCIFGICYWGSEQLKLWVLIANLESFSNFISFLFFSIVLSLPIIALEARCTLSRTQSATAQPNRLVSSTSSTPTSTDSNSTTLTSTTSHSKSSSTQSVTSKALYPESHSSMGVAVTTLPSSTFSTSTTSGSPGPSSSESATATSGATRNDFTWDLGIQVLGLGLGIMMVVWSSRYFVWAGSFFSLHFSSFIYLLCVMYFYYTLALALQLPWKLDQIGWITENCYHCRQSRRH